jgi:hypothetical protein
VVDKTRRDFEGEQAEKGAQDDHKDRCEATAHEVLLCSPAKKRVVGIH